MAEAGVVTYQNLYQQEFDNVFDKKDYFVLIHKKAKSGFLENSRFRSVCWRLYLNVLSEDKGSWHQDVSRGRTLYDELKLKHHIDPRSNLWADDNPLSTSTMSPWNWYFSDVQLQLVIHQDVVRTFPDQELFKELDIQDMMVEILFIFARTYPKIKYKQGMHELLAPIIYVMKNDIKEYNLAHAEEGFIQIWCNYLFMSKYIEQDCYTLFVKVMDIVASWYIMDGWEKTENHLDPRLNVQTDDNPLSASQMELVNDVPISANSLHSVIQDIWSQCKVHDHEVYDHLTNLEIAPHIYGIRWLKLLFGREFKFEDLFIIWDVILSDSTQKNIHKYIFIAMLISIRHLLLASDYSSCMSHLMKFPHVENIQYILDLAFHLRNPTKYSRPECANSSLAASFKKKEEKTKVKTSLFSSSVRLASSSTGKIGATRPKTVDLNPEKTNFFFKKGLYLKGLSVEKSSMSVECSKESLDFSEPYPESTSSSSYRMFPSSRIPNVMGNATETQRASDFIKLQEPTIDDKALERPSREMKPIAPRIQSDVSRKEVSVEVKEQMNFMASTINNMIDKNQHCANDLDTVIEDLRDITINQDFPGANKIIAALQELEKIKLVLEGTIPYDDSTCPHSPEKSLSARKQSSVQGVATTIASKETDRSDDEGAIDAKEKFN